MIRDKQFKNLGHTYEDYAILTTGGELEKGYKPDFVLNKNEEYIILESENSTSRKHILGGMIKAAHYLQGDRKGILVIVLTPKDNTTVDQISHHLKLYFDWIKDKTNLSKVFVINSKDYWDGEHLVSMDSDEFRNKAQSV